MSNRAYDPYKIGEMQNLNSQNYFHRTNLKTFNHNSAISRLTTEIVSSSPLSLHQPFRRFPSSSPQLHPPMAHRFVAFVSPSPSVRFACTATRLSFFHGLCVQPRTAALCQPICCADRRSTFRMVATETAGKKGGKKSKKNSGAAKREKKSSASPGLLKALEKYEPIIGIEVHVQLATNSKAYCPCPTKPVRTPNVNVCPVCMGHPGALPVVNAKVVELAAKAGMALNCKIAKYSAYDRKNYYYVDTSKNYQITQDRFPIAQHGSITLSSSNKIVGITRLHMEEDSAKMSHEGAGASGRLTDSTHSLVDFNRAGVPLIEIVSEPDLRTGAEAAEYGQELQRILRYVGTSDCNMQDGSLRCDVNISIRPKGEQIFGTKVELKNLNSFSSAQKSVDFEIERQAAVLDAGESVVMETRTWDEKTNETKTMRVKEGSADYRYFPEPDIPPLQLSDEQLQRWRKQLPELPVEKRERYQTQFGLSVYDAFLLSDDVSVAKYFDQVVAAGGDAKQAANWIMGDITKVLKTEKIDIKMCKLRPDALAQMICMIDDGIISGKIAKDLTAELVLQGGSPAEIVEERNLKLISDPDAIREIIVKVMEDNPKELGLYRDGKTKLFGFFVGKTLAVSEGRADPAVTNRLLKEILEG